MRLINAVPVKKAIIFGAGRYGAFWHETLKNDLEVIGFIDNDPQKQKKTFMGLPVYSISEYSTARTCDTTILVSLFHKIIADHIIAQLKTEYALSCRDSVLWLYPALQEVSDEVFIRRFYKIFFDHELDLLNPKTYNEKLQWLKLNDRKNEYTQLADKFAVRQYVANKIGKKYLVPLLGVWDRFDDIDFSKLPEKFVLKCTHDSGSAVIFRNGKMFDKYGTELANIQFVKTKLNDALVQNWFYLGREWAYKKVQPRIIAEQYLGTNIEDYRFYVFGGKVMLIHVDFDTAVLRKANIYSPTWEYYPCSWTYPTDSKHMIEKPAVLDEMIDLVESLTKGLTHLRVDLFLRDEKIYFLETGFYHGSGFDPIVPSCYDKLFGSWLTLPN